MYHDGGNKYIRAVTDIDSDVERVQNCHCSAVCTENTLSNTSLSNRSSLHITLSLLSF